MAEKQYGEAAELYRALYKEKPSAGGAVSLADALALGGQNAQAIAVLTDWLASHPDDTAVRFALSTRYIESGNSMLPVRKASVSSRRRQTLQQT